MANNDTLQGSGNGQSTKKSGARSKLCDNLAMAALGSTSRCSLAPTRAVCFRQTASMMRKWDRALPSSDGRRLSLQARRNWRQDAVKLKSEFQF